MDSILTYENLIEHIREIDDPNEQIIAFVYAPYNENKIAEVVNQFYDFWNIKFDDSILHLYWLGYINAADNKLNRWKVDSHANDCLYYDIKVFNSLINELNKKWKFKYKGDFEIILVKYKQGRIFFNDQIRIDLENNFASVKDIKNIFYSIHEVINEYKTFYALKKEIKNKAGIQRLKKVKIGNLLELLSYSLKV